MNKSVYEQADRISVYVMQMAILMTKAAGRKAWIEYIDSLER